MKRMFAMRLVTVLLGLAAGSAFAAEKWDKAQQEIADVVQAFAKANVTGNLDQMMDCAAPAFTAWDFSKPAPVDRATYRKTETEFYKNWTVLDCVLTPTLIRVEKDTAIVHGRHVIAVQSMNGAKRTMEGSWTAALIHGDNRWLFINLSWVDDRPATNEAATRQAVSLAMKGFLAAGERVDLEGVWAFNATTPDYQYADMEGKLFDLAGARKSWSDSFAGFLKAKYTTRQENILVLGPDTAVHVWNGSCACTLKDGAVVNVEPLTFTSIWRRIDGAWKIFRFHESAPPPQPTTPPVGAEAEIRRTDAELVATANAHDLESWLAFFEPDARLLPPGAPPISGPDAIRGFATAVMKTPGFAVVHNLESVEVARDGQSAWVTYSFALTMRDEKGNPVTEKGKDTTLYRKGTDGRWRVLVDSWGKHMPTK